MNEHSTLRIPTSLTRIYADTAKLGFKMASEEQTGSLLRTLAASKPGSAFLEIGTGTGVGTAWLLDGMDEHSTLITVERDEEVSAIAQRHLCKDERVSFLTMDADAFLNEPHDQQFDFIFADSFPGKFHLLDEALAMLKVGGLYIIDDLMTQPTWPDGHQQEVDRLISELQSRRNLILTKLQWASGLIIATRTKV
jgi:predicted O-methyltransferase YrrM